MKKTLGILTALALSLLALCGCGGTSSGGETAETPAEEPAYTVETYGNLSYELPSGFTKSETDDTSYEANGMVMHIIDYSYPDGGDFSVTVNVTTLSEYMGLSPADYAQRALDMFRDNLPNAEEKTLADGTVVIVGNKDNQGALNTDNLYLLSAEDTVACFEFKGPIGETETPEMDAEFDHLLSTLTVSAE